MCLSVCAFCGNWVFCCGCLTSSETLSAAVRSQGVAVGRICCGFAPMKVCIFLHSRTNTPESMPAANVCIQCKSVSSDRVGGVCVCHSPLERAL